MKSDPRTLTVIIPAYNEEKGLAVLLPQLMQKRAQTGWEIIVVNDGSTDGTQKVVKTLAPQALLINHKVNSGYGASIKSGILAARTTWIATVDADGQHRIQDLEKMLDHCDGYDAVIGMRPNSRNSGLLRMPGKFILKAMFRLITGRRIKDINCGLRVIKRKVMCKIFGLACDRFSFSTSTMIALLNFGYAVKFVEIEVQKRLGRSSVRVLSDGMEAILLMLRMVTLFNPFRVFLPVAGFLLLLGLAYQTTAFFIYGFTIQKSALLLIMSGLMLFLFSLQQDQISSLRREVASFELKLAEADKDNDDSR
ncbi:MAG: glycosyltransferase family 2 protein [Candidatus Omnitrophota bacterium]